MLAGLGSKHSQADRADAVRSVVHCKLINLEANNCSAQLSRIARVDLVPFKGHKTQ